MDVLEEKRIAGTESGDLWEMYMRPQSSRLGLPSYVPRNQSVALSFENNQ